MTDFKICSLIFSLHATLFFSAVVQAEQVIEQGATEKVPSEIVGVKTIVIRGKSIENDYAQEVSVTPGGVSLIDSNELFQRDVSSLADILHFTPGVWSNSNQGSDGITLSIRGSNLDATNYDMNGVKFLQDGLSITTADGNNHNRLPDPFMMRYATVARGANAVAYGASTLGGAIDFITPTARNSEPNQLYINSGSFGSMQQRVSLGSVVNENLDAMLTMENKHFDGFREHSALRRSSVYANTGWQLNEQTENRLYLSHIESDAQLAGYLSATQFKADPSQAEASAVSGNFQLNVNADRIANIATWDLGNKQSLEFGVSLEQQTLYHPIVDKVLLIDTDHQDTGTMLRYKTEIDKHHVILGLNYAENKVEGGQYRNDGGKRNGLTTKVNNSAENLEVFALDRFFLNDTWTIIYGAQGVLTSREIKNTDVAKGTLRNPKQDYSSVNPRAGVIYNFNKQKELFANISKLYEAPTNFELEDEVSAGNKTLKAMSGNVLEVGARGTEAFGESNDWSWDVAFYHAKISDAILSLDDPTKPGKSLSANFDDTIHQGIEAIFSANLFYGAAKQHRIEPLLNFTLNDFNFDNDALYGNNQLPAAPDYFINAQILYRSTNGFYAGPTFDVVGERYADFSNTYKLDDYELLGLIAGYQKDKLQVFAEAKNISDKEYVATHKVKDIAAATDAILNPGAPTSINLGMKIEF